MVVVVVVKRGTCLEYRTNRSEHFVYIHPSMDVRRRKMVGFVGRCSVTNMCEQDGHISGQRVGQSPFSSGDIDVRAQTN